MPRRCRPDETARRACRVHHATSRSPARRAGCADRGASHSDTAILPSGSARRQRLLPHDVEAGGFEPLRHRLGREAEPAMGVLVAQEFEVVRREIDHQQPAARPQHARRLADRARAVVEEVQHLVDDDDVEGVARQREIVDVALAHAAMLAGRRGRAARARAPACRATDRCRGRARCRGRTVRACGRCRCRDRAASGIGWSASAARIAASTASSATCSSRMRSHSAAWPAE